MLMAGNTLLGYFIAMQGVEEVHLLNITVAPEYQGQGWSRVLLDALAEEVDKDLDPFDLLLHVAGVDGEEVAVDDGVGVEGGREGTLLGPQVGAASDSADGAPQPGSEQTLPDERAEHADVLAVGDRVAVVWRSSEGAVTTLKAWLSQDGGQNFVLRILSQVTGYNDHPRLVQSGSRRVVVWRNAQEIQVHELTF